MRKAVGGTIEVLLRQAAVFHGMSDLGLEHLAAVVQLRRLGKGQLLFSRGDRAAAFFVVHSGSIALGLDSANGRELVINEMHPGDGFGELALLTGEPRSTSAVAREDSVVLVVPQRDFLAAVQSEPALARNLLQTAAHRLGTSSEREGALAFLSAPSRLARVLVELDRQSRAEGYIVISQEQLGQRVGLARQTVAELLGKWRRSGWILTGRGRIVLLNRAALRGLVEEEET